MQEIQVRLNRKDGTQIFDLSVPNKWDELSSVQLLYVAEKWQHWKNLIITKVSLNQEKANLFIKLIGNKTKKELRKIVEALSYIDGECDSNILDATEFLFGELNLTKNVMPVIKISTFKKIYGPADKLKNICIDELSFAFFYYSAYNKTNEEKYLNFLFATLYRDRDKNGIHKGDIRKDFNPNLIEIHALKTDKINNAYKQATLIYFMGCLEFISKRFPFVFKRIEGSEKPSGTASLLNVIIGISGSKFGDFDKTKNQNAYVVLTELNSLMSPKKK